jgi:D-sedoheptulose 7-phosphate isomerase
MTGMESLLSRLIAEATGALESLQTRAEVFDRICRAAADSLRAGGKILTCGNGGSAADAMHLAEELMGRYKANRRPLPAVCLNADPTLLTCIANDFGFDEVFARQVEGLAGPNDLLVCFSTSGNSPNILRALETARTAGARTVALLGRDGGNARGRADLELIVAGNDTARIQEAHTLILHGLLEFLETETGAAADRAAG